MFYLYVIYYLSLYFIGLFVAYKLTEDKARRRAFLFINVIGIAIMLMSVFINHKANTPSGSMGPVYGDDVIFLVIVMGVKLLFNTIWLLSVIINYMRRSRSYIELLWLPIIIQLTIVVVNVLIFCDKGRFRLEAGILSIGLSILIFVFLLRDNLKLKIFENWKMFFLIVPCVFPAVYLIKRKKYFDKD